MSYDATNDGIEDHCQVCVLRGERGVGTPCEPCLDGPNYYSEFVLETGLQGGDEM